MNWGEVTPGEVNVMRDYAQELRVRSAKGERVSLQELQWLTRFERLERGDRS